MTGFPGMLARQQVSSAMKSTQMATTPSLPTVTIVTVCFNARDTVEKTITSVLSQSYAQIEYVVVDGGSSDGTAEIVRRFGPELAAWVSERDAGISEAMNKGLRMSGGELLLFLHADDYLVDTDAIASAIDQVNESNADIYAFDIYFSTTKGLQRYRPRGYTWHMNFKTGVYHQAALCRRRLFERIGHFDPTLRIAMDYDFFLRAYRADAVLRRVPAAFSVMRDTGISSRRDWASLQERFREERAVQARASPGRAMQAVYSTYWPTYLAYRRALTALSGG
jgi:glycosyltransferase involved in cell wall biosynthesis